MDYQLYIDGKWTNGTGKDEIAVINPATEETFARVPEASADDVEQAIIAARRAFDEGPWGRTTPRERSKVLVGFADILERRMNEFVDLVVAEVGTPLKLAKGLQVFVPLLMFRDTVDRVLTTFDFSSPLPPTFGAGIGQGVVLREPIGVVSAISPFNYPFFVNLSKIAPALAAGCTTVLRPSPFTPLSAIEIARAAEEAGLPPGVLNVVTGDIEAAKLLTTHPAVDLVTFTGSVPVGAEIMRQAASGIKKVVLELGGKNATVLLEDCNLDLAVADAAIGMIRNTGQGCGCISRILVHESRYDEAVEGLVARVAAYKIGSPTDPETDIGPMIRESQRARTERYVGIGKDEGARLAYGGGRPEGAEFDKGFWVEPTVFADVKSSMVIAQEEIFGPVGVVIPFSDDAEAVAIANDSTLGLNGAVWSADPVRGYKLCTQIKAGRMVLNGAGGAPNPHAPLGGYKMSGIGREFGEVGMAEFLETKAVSWGVAGG